MAWSVLVVLVNELYAGAAAEVKRQLALINVEKVERVVEEVAMKLEAVGIGERPARSGVHGDFVGEPKFGEITPIGSPIMGPTPIDPAWFTGARSGTALVMTGLVVLAAVADVDAGGVCAIATPAVEAITNTVMILLRIRCLSV